MDKFPKVITAPIFEQSGILRNINHINHGFFTRIKGENNNNFNCSLSFGSKEQAILNRRLAANIIGGEKCKLAMVKQIHSNKVLIIDDEYDFDNQIAADAMVSATRGIALAILTADCAPIIFTDKNAPIIGIAHAGVNGAIGGVIKNTILAMVKLGAKRENIIAIIGATISGENYEIGEERALEIAKINPRTKSFIFIPKGKKNKHFNLPKFIENELKKSEIAKFANLNICTYANPKSYFSHRFYTHFGGVAGRQISIIALT